MIGATIALFLLTLFLISAPEADFLYDSGTGKPLLCVKVLGLRFWVFGGEKKRRRRPRKEKKRKEKPEAAEKKKPDKELIRALVRGGLDSLKRLGRKLGLDLVVLRFKAASPDAAKAAQMYGYVNAAVGIFFPLVDTTLRVREREIDISLDFMSDTPTVYFRIIVSLQVWELFYVAGGLAKEYLRYKLKSRKNEL